MQVKKSKRIRNMESLWSVIGLLMNTNQKGNTGRAAARRRLFYLGMVLVILVALLGIIHLCMSPLTDNHNHPKLVQRHAKALRRTPQAKSSKLTLQQQKEFILSGKLNLIDIRVNRNEMARAPAGSYNGVYGTFCRLNFAAHKADPSGGMCSGHLLLLGDYFMPLFLCANFELCCYISQIQIIH